MACQFKINQGICSKINLPYFAVANTLNFKQDGKKTRKK
jgi:hypothetical protein